MQTISNYFEKTKSYPTLRFIIESSFIALIGKLLIGFLMAAFLIYNHININKLPTPDYHAKSNLTFLFFWVCLFAPAIETILSQWLPITLLKKITSNTILIISIDTILFALAHWHLYGFIKLLTILPSGIILAWSFILKSDESFLKAFWITVSIHALINFSVFLPLAFF